MNNKQDKIIYIYKEQFIKGKVLIIFFIQIIMDYQ